MQLVLDLTQTIDIPALKLRISALHKQLGYGARGRHLGNSLWYHLGVESMSEAHDTYKLLEYERCLEGKR